MKKLLCGIAAIVAGLAAAGAAHAEDVTLRLSHWVPALHPVAAQAILPWTESITKASGGSIKFDLFPAGQLGKPEDHYDIARDGIADFAWVNPGFNAGRFSIFAAVQVPLTVSDGMGGIVALNKWYGEEAPKEMGDVKFCLAHMMSPLIFSTTKRIEHPADLKGLKIRPSSAMEAHLIRNLGGSTVPGGNPEAREMISRGIVDGTTGVAGSQFVFGVNDVTKYHLFVPLSAVSFVLVMNKDRYDGLTDDQKAVIDAHCNPEAALKFFAAPQTFETEGMAKLRALKDGREVIEPTPELMAEWKAAAEPVREEWAKEVTAKGFDAKALLEGLRSALRAENALVE